MSKNANDLLFKRLVDFGFGEKEAQIYLTLLELEIGTVHEIAKASGINRSSAYVVLESLKKKGFVGISEDKKVLRYFTTSPDALHNVAESRAKHHEEIRRSIDDIVPELKALHRDTKQRPKVRIYEGKEGLIAAFEDSLKCRDKLMRVSSYVENLFSIIPQDYFASYIKRRMDAKIKMRGIHPYNEFAHRILKMGPGNYDEIALVPEKDFHTPVDLAIYDDKIGYMSAENGGFAIFIEGKEITDAMKSIFDLAWQEAKRIQKQAKISLD